MMILGKEARLKAAEGQAREHDQQEPRRREAQAEESRVEANDAKPSSSTWATCPQ
jgi:hypothetical protein